MEPEKLSFACPACQGVLRIPFELAGVRGPCPKCQTEIAAPIPATQTPASIISPVPVGVPAIPPFPTPTAAPTHPAQTANQQPQQAYQSPPPQPAPVPLPPSAPQQQPQQQPQQPNSQSLPGLAPQQMPVGNQPPLTPPQNPLQPVAVPLPRRPDAPAEPIAEPEQPVQQTIPTKPASSSTTRSPKRKKKRTQKSQKSVSTSKGGLSAIVKLGIPVLLLAGIAVGAVKYWPQIQTKLGFGNDAPSTDQPPAVPIATDPTTAEDPSGFQYIDSPETKTSPVTPSPDARFSAEPETEPIQLGDEPSVAPKAKVKTAFDEGDKAGGVARQILEKALASKSIEEMSKYVLAPSRVVPKMKAYYKEKSPAVVPTSIIYEDGSNLPEAAEPNHTHTFFLATQTQTLRFPVALQDTDKGPKLDWESFIEMHDDHLGKFLASPTSESGSFHVILTRSHYFRGDVPKLGSKDCFRISTPIPGSEGYAFVDKDAAVAKECEAFEWDRVCFAIAELAWVTPEDGKPYLTIQRVLQTNWRAQDDA